jgi:hypothetical protein
MTQALYAHMNNKRKKKDLLSFSSVRAVAMVYFNL